jgi:hypothetical protein
MRIVIVTHRVVHGDGQGRVNYEIARAALQHGHSVLLIASAVDESLRDHPALDWHPISVDGFPTALLRNQVFAWRSARAIPAKSVARSAGPTNWMNMPATRS